MTGYDDGYWIAPYRLTNRLRRATADTTGQFSIGNGLPIRYFHQRTPHFLLEVCTMHGKLWQKVGLVSSKVQIQPTDNLTIIERLAC